MRKAQRIVVVVFAGLALIFFFTRCARYDGSCDAPQAPVAAAPVAPVPTLNPEDALIQSLVATQNVSREAQGQTALTPGLSCQLWTFTGGDRIEPSISGHNQLSGLQYRVSWLLTEPFNQANTVDTQGMSILPEAFQSIYQTYYYVSCTGFIVVTSDDFYTFQVSADDAALVYVDGQLTLNDDNAHSVATVTNAQYLEQGVHSFTVQYAQNGGWQALIINQGNTNDALSVLQPKYFFH